MKITRVWQFLICLLVFVLAFPAQAGNRDDVSIPLGLRVSQIDLDQIGGGGNGKGDCDRGSSQSKGGYLYYLIYCAENGVLLDVRMTASGTLPFGFLGNAFANDSTFLSVISYYYYGPRKPSRGPYSSISYYLYLGYYGYNLGYYVGGLPGTGRFTQQPLPAIDWGDGEVASNVALVNGGGGPQPKGGNMFRGIFAHTYDQPGNYTVRVFAPGKPVSATINPIFGQAASGNWTYNAYYGCAYNCSSAVAKGGGTVTNTVVQSGTGPFGINANATLTAGIPPANVPATGLLSKLLLGLVLLLTGSFVLMRR